MQNRPMSQDHATVLRDPRAADDQQHDNRGPVSGRAQRLALAGVSKRGLVDLDPPIVHVREGRNTHRLNMLHPAHSWVFATDGQVYCPHCKTVMQQVQDAEFHEEQAELSQAGFIRLGDKIRVRLA